METLISGPASWCRARRGEAYDLSVALNYSYTVRSHQLLHFINKHVELIHKPQHEGWEMRLTYVSTSTIDI